MPSLNVIINGTSDPFAKELQAVQRLARSTGANISRGLSGESGHGASRSGVVGETLVLIRELGRGNYARIPGSILLLIQRLGVLKYILKDTSSAASVLADAWAKQAEKAGIAALASTRKAQASMAALYSDIGETEATLNAAIADEEKAMADVAVAQATQAKAIASAEAAAAAEAEAGAAALSIGPLGLVAGAVIAIGIGAYAASKLVKYLTDTLSGVKTSGFDAEYILKREQKGGQAADGQRLINNEIAKSIDLYNSAAEAAKRVDQATGTHFDHLRKMNQYREETEMQAAHSEATRAAIRKKYSDQQLAIDRQEREENIRNKAKESYELKKESDFKKKQADAIDVASSKQDENDLNFAKEKYQALKEANDKIQESKNNPNLDMRKIYRGYNAVVNSPVAQALLTVGLGSVLGGSGVTNADLDKAELKIRTDKMAAEMEVRRLSEQKDKNDMIRKRKEDLTKQAADDAGKAATITESLPILVRQAAQKNQDEAEEAAAKLSAEHKLFQPRAFALNAQQRVGAYSTSAASVPEKMLEQLREIKKNTSKPTFPPVGKTPTHFGGIHQ